MGESVEGGDLLTVLLAGCSHVVGSGQDVKVKGTLNKF